MLNRRAERPKLQHSPRRPHGNAHPAAMFAGRLSRRRLTLEPLEPRLVLDAGPLIISEFMAINDSTLNDAEGESPDWIEIHNPTAALMNLDGWYLTDDADDLTKWQFPAVSVAPGEFLVVFASDKDLTDPAELHTNFKLRGDGEYLAIVQPDGVTVAHEYAPKYPDQLEDVSYGVGSVAAVWETLTSSQATIRYHVPVAGDDPLGLATVGYDDSAWTETVPAVGPSLVFSEISTAADDWFEIQNVADHPLDTSGWFVAISNANTDISSVNPVVWDLPASVAWQETLYVTDDDSDNDHYLGGGISWRTTGNGWVAIIDDQGEVADFLAWGYTEAEIASLRINAGGFDDVGIGKRWAGEGAARLSERDSTLQRIGAADNNAPGDFTWLEPSMGEPNADLIVPFAGLGAVATAIGFSGGNAEFDRMIQTNVAEAMQGVNASFYSRVDFRVDNPSKFVEMTLRIRYDDGFVAYLNGIEVARAGAPDSLAYDSAATAPRSDSAAAVFEEIDLSGRLAEVLQFDRNVLAIHGLNYAADDDDFLIDFELTARSDLGDPQYMSSPTPGEQNLEGSLGWVEDTSFSLDRGFYDEPFEVAIDTKTDGATIRYTLDASEPTETNGLDYTGPLTVSTTTTLRAAAFEPGYIPSNVDTQTYIFVEQVLTQTRPVGYPTSWGSAPGVDYDVDPEIANDPQYHDDLIAGLTTIPTLSVVLNVDDMFGSRGLYSQPQNETLEKPTSAELIYPDGSKGFQVDAGLKIQGGASRRPDRSAKHSMSLRFRQTYGLGRLDFPLFEDSPVDRFNSIQLRAMYNNSWIHWDSGQRSRGSMIRDQWVRDSLLDMGQDDAGRGTFVHLYVNGLYWGVYNAHERQEASHYASYHGGDDQRIDALNAGPPIDGTSASWNSLQNLLNSAVSGGISLGEYEEIASKLDVLNLADYMIVNHYGGNADWDDHNWRAAGGGPDDAPWRIYSWDAERVLEGTSSNRTGQNSSGDPSRLFQNLRNSEEFRLLFADRLQKHFFNDGALTPDEAAERWMRRADELDLAIVGESARWGDYRRDVHSSSNGPYLLYTKNDHWLPEQQRLINSYFPVRSGVVLQQYRNMGLYGGVEAPTFHVDGSPQHGGRIATTDLLGMPAPAGRVYYTLDGSDPRLPGGEVSAGAASFDGTKILLSESTVVKARALVAGEWSALSEAQFLVGTTAAAGNLVVGEINYNPYDPTPAELDALAELDLDAPTQSDDFEFIELQNVGPETIDLAEVRFADGIDFNFSYGSVTKLAHGQYVVVVANPDAFAARYGTQIQVAGQYDRSLSNTGERVRLVDDAGKDIFSFRYNDSAAWPGRADGKGASLELIDPTAVPHDEPQRTIYLEDDDHWRSSSEFGGSPGSPGSGPIGVVLNEVLTHTHPPLLDAVELHNPTEEAIDVGGWFLSDSWGWASSEDNGNYSKYRIDDGTIIDAGGYLVLDESHFNPNGEWNPQAGIPGENEFALDGAHGDDVWLMKADATGRLTDFVDHVEFGAAREGEALGRWPDGQGALYPMVAPTLGEANSGPRLAAVILSEIHYNSAQTEPSQGAEELEFVEIYNPTSKAADLTEWRLRGGVDFDFAQGTELAARSTSVVLPFDPQDAANADLWSAFCTEYGLDPQQAAGFVGGYSGRLENRGEAVRLLSPDESPVEEPQFVPHVLEDEVDYRLAAPWPPPPADGGQSLNRLGIDSWGNDGASWAYAQPTPGAVDLAAAATVTGRYVFYHNSTFDNAGDHHAIAPDKEPLLPGRSATFANYTSYAKGINGVMVDLSGLPDGASPSADDFAFKVGNDQDPAGWPAAAEPSTISVRRGEGVAGSDRVTILWPQNAIENEWLQVTVLATENTGLHEPDVFYFGNAIGEAGNSPLNAIVNATDEIVCRNFQHGPTNLATIDDPYDYNRDQFVNSTDRAIARNHQTGPVTALRLITAPAAGAETAAAFASDVALTEADPQQSGSARISLDQLDWLLAAEQPDGPDASSKTEQSIAAAIDQLLATYDP